MAIKRLVCFKSSVHFSKCVANKVLKYVKDKRDLAHAHSNKYFISLC